MQASEIAGVISLVVIVGAATLGQGADSGVERVAWHLLSIATLVWYLLKGHSLKGWIGDSYQEMKEEISRLRRQMDSGVYADGRTIPPDEFARIASRYQRLTEKIQFHPDSPRR